MDRIQECKEVTENIRHRGWDPPQPPHTVKMKNILISIAHVYSKFRKKEKEKKKRESQTWCLYGVINFVYYQV
jgi:hypothetical protein